MTIYGIGFIVTLILVCLVFKPRENSGDAIIFVSVFWPLFLLPTIGHGIMNIIENKIWK